MAWILIIVGLILIGIVLYMWLFVRPKGSSDYLDVAERQQKQLDTEASVLTNPLRRAKIRSNTKTQQTITENTLATTEAIKQRTAAEEAALSRTANDQAFKLREEEAEAEARAKIARNQAEEREAVARLNLAQLAEQKGLDVESVIAVNKHHWMTQIDLQKMRSEIEADLDAADRYDLTANQLINKLTEHLKELIRERHAIDAGDDPQAVKDAIRLRYDKNIKVVEDLIDARQERLLLSEGGEAAGGNSEAETEGGADNQAEAEAAEI